MCLPNLPFATCLVLPVCVCVCVSGLPPTSQGAVFDRQASVRRSLVSTDTVSRRPKKVKRRKTISGLPDNVDLELGTLHCVNAALCWTQL